MIFTPPPVRGALIWLLVAGNHRRFTLFGICNMQHNADKRREKKEKILVMEWRFLFKLIYPRFSKQVAVKSSTIITLFI